MRLSSLLVALAVAVALPLTGCDSNGIDLPCTSGCTPGGGGNPGGTPGGGGTPNATFVQVNPMQTYLRVETGFQALDAPAVSLDDLGVAEGESVCFQASGDYFIADGVLSSDVNPGQVLAVFSGTPVLEDTAQRFRVPDALDAGEDVVSPATINSDEPTDIEEDFDATDACVTVPDGARYVFFSVWDNYFDDNTDADADGAPFGVAVRRD